MNSVKLPVFCCVALTTWSLVAATSAHAYVVIDNYNSGGDAFTLSYVGTESSGPKATGTIVDGHRGNSRLRNDFFATSSNESGNSRQSSRKQLIRYQSTNRGGKSAAGGGGGSAGRGGSRNLGLSQSVVSTHGHAHSPNHGGNAGTNLNVFHGRGPSGNGSGGSQGPGSAGGGAGAGGPAGGGGSGGGGGGSPSHVCGTPEPAAFTVWAIAGCCGYGLVRCRQRWFSAK